MEDFTTNEGFEPSTEQELEVSAEVDNSPEEVGSEEAGAQPQTFSQADIDRIVQSRLQREREKYSPYQSFVEESARQYGMTPEQYIQAVQEQKEQAEREEFEQQYGISPDAINQALESHPDIQFARNLKAQQEATEKFNREAEELFKAYPDLQVNDIPQEVFMLQQQQNLPLLTAYRAAMFDKVKSQSEQAAIKKLQTNASNTPGALGTEAAESTKSISKMGKKDFNELLNKALRGEIKEL